MSGQSNGQPTVRHIPIYVEGRDEPIVNTGSQNSSSGTPSVSPATSGSNMPTQSGTQQPQPNNQQQAGQHIGGQNSIFSRVKNFPVRSDSEIFQGRGNSASQFGQRTQSPGRTIPVNVSRSESKRSPSPAQVHRPTTAPPSTTAMTGTQSPVPTPNTEGHRDDSIEKIQKIQRDVLALMDQVEQFKGTSKRDKQYMYLDEMLTQNLLKLDTIETEGKDNIKQARREAIKCINICIAALERKTEEAAAAAAAATVSTNGSVQK